MSKAGEILLEKLDRVLTIKEFIGVLIIYSLLYTDYDNGILLESIECIPLVIIIVFLGGCIYNRLKKAEKEFIHMHDAREWKDDRYIIESPQFDIIIIHYRRRVLIGEDPKIIIRIKNKKDKIIENIAGYIDLFNSEVGVIHQKINIDYVLPKTEREMVLVDGEDAYKTWSTGKYVYVENGHKKVISGEPRAHVLDLEYWGIKNKKLHIIKTKFKDVCINFSGIWNGTGWGEEKWINRMLLIIAVIVFMAIALLILWRIKNELYAWLALHINTYFK